MSLSSFFKKINRRDTRVFPKFSKTSKIILSITLLLLVGLFVRNTLAADNILKTTWEAQNKGNNAESWQQNAWNTNVVNVFSSVAGTNVSFDENGNITGYAPSGMIGSVNQMIGSLYTPQASGVQYIAQTTNDFLGKPAIAATGFTALQPILPVWKTFRNIAYSLFSVFFIAIGIMIMLRVKLNPQTVVSLQNSIPQLITALIMVTFSYAIAGLVIDLSYVFQAMAINILYPLVSSVNWANLFPYDPSQIPANAQDLNNGTFGTLTGIFRNTISMDAIWALSAMGAQIIAGVLSGGSVNGGGGQFLFYITYGIGGVIFLIIIVIVCIIWLVKLWFGLLKAYCFIIYRIIVAPIEIALGAFPNSKLNFSTWLTGLVARVMIFPVVLIVTLFILYLSKVLSETNIWIPNLLKPGGADLAGDVSKASFLGAAVGLGGLSLLSKLPAIVPEAIFSIKQSLFEKAIGEGLKDTSGITGPIKKFGGTIQEGASSGIGGVIKQRYLDRQAQKAKDQEHTGGGNTTETSPNNTVKPPITSKK